MTLTLAPGEVHVSHATLTDDWKLPPDVISSDEKARASRLTRQPLRDMKAFSFYVRRCVLASYLDLMPADLRFDVSEEGKPFLVHDKAVSFNVSDTGNRLLIAVSLQPVGVDIESCSRCVTAPGLESHVLSPEEIDRWRALNPKEASDYLLHAWVAKEAYVKCLGKGLHGNMTQVTVFPGSDKDSLKSPDSSLMLQWISVDEQYVSAVCLQGNIQKIVARRWQDS